MIIYQYRIYRQDLANNPNATYVFGDNVARVGFGGQAKEMRGQPNAVGIATKHKPTMHDDAFFSDRNSFEEKAIIKHDFEKLIARLESSSGPLIIPSDGIGIGLSQLPQRAPIVNEYLSFLFDKIIKEFS